MLTCLGSSVHRGILVAAWGSVVACGGEVPLAEARLPSCLVVTPEAVDFSDVDLNATPQPPEERRIRLTNPVQAGCNPSIQLRDYNLTGDGVFSVGGVGDIRLDAGQSTYIPVRFSPTRPGDHRGAVQVVVVEEPAPRSIPLSGRALGPVIHVDPETMDLGAPYVGCRNTGKFRITNRGNAPLVLTDLEQLAPTPSEFTFDPDTFTNGPLPWTLAPYNADHGEPALEVYVDYVPQDVYRDEAAVTVQSNDPVRPTLVSVLRGTGTSFAEQVDVHVQQTPGKVDILFALSRSDAMRDDMGRTFENLDALAAAMARLETPFHAAITVTDGGCVVGESKFVDHTFSASEAQAAFRAMADLSYTSTSYGSNTERPWVLLGAALSPKNIGPGGCNEAFYREDAELALVMVADGGSSVEPWTSYLRAFQTLKERPEDLRISAISGDYPSGCASASASEGGYVAAFLTGGVYASICRTNWWQDLTFLTDPGDLVRSFRLSGPHVPSTIEVYVDGRPVPRGWAYEAASGSVRFDDFATPPAGSRIEIRYQKLADCEG